MKKPETQDITGATTRGPVLLRWHTCLSMALAVGILAVLISALDFRAVWRELAGSAWGWVAAGAGVHYATYPVRGYRWQRCLRHVAVTGGTWRFTLVVFFHNFVDNVVPAKLGDLYGAHLAFINCGVQRSVAFGSLVFLRLLDAWVILGAAVASFVALSTTRLPPAVRWALGGGAALALLASTAVLLLFLLRRAPSHWPGRRLRHILDLVRLGLSPRRRELLPLAGLTALLWGMETACLALMAKAFGVGLGPAEAAFVTTLPAIASSFPLTPGGLGVVDLTLVGCLRVLGIGGLVAVSLTIVNRFFDYWLHVAVGVLLWAARGWLGFRTWRDVPSAARHEVLGSPVQHREKTHVH